MKFKIKSLRNIKLGVFMQVEMAFPLSGWHEDALPPQIWK